MDCDDRILSTLATDMVDRRGFKVEIHDDQISEGRIDEIRTMIADKMQVDMDDTDYLMSVATVEKDMYDTGDDSITILYRDGSLKDISEASELLNVQTLSQKRRKYYLCYQRV